MKKKSSYGILFFIICIHAIYFFAACCFKGFYLIDSYGYLMQADNIKTTGSWYAEDWNAPLLIDYFSIRPPLYAWFNIGLGWIWNSVYFVLIIQNILSVFNCWLAYRFVTHKLDNAQYIQWVMYACLLFYPAQMMHANFIMTEILFQTFLLLLFINTFLFFERPNWKQSIIISALLSLCLLTKPVSLFLPFIILVFIVWGVVKKKGRWIFLMPFILVAITFHVICLQNQHATNYYHYSSIKSINLLKYNAKYTLINARGEQYADSVIAASILQANAYKNYGERLQYMESEATAIIMEYPLAFIQLYAKGVISFFIDPGRFDVYRFFAIEEKKEQGLLHRIQTNGIGAIVTYLKKAPLFILVLFGINLFWNMLVVVALVYFLFSNIISLECRILIFLFIFYIAAATGPVGVSRYRVPVYPILMMGVMFAYNTFIARKKLTNA